MTIPIPAPRRAARVPRAGLLAAALAAGALGLACNDATEPLQIDAYGYRVAVPNSAGGTDSLAFHWSADALPVKVWVENAADLPALTRTALSRWSDAVGSGTFRGSVVADSADARIIVRFMQPPQAEFGVRRLGSALVQPCEGAADIFVDTDARAIDLPLHVYVFTGDDPTAPAIHACLDATLTHEIGHTIGLFQHSPHPEDVMYRLPTVAVPSVHDRATAFYLYKGPSQLSPAAQ
jgi:hypothetical protein